MADYRNAGMAGGQDRNAQRMQGGRSGPPGGQGSGTGGYAEGASELWDSAYEQGERYYRRGAQAVGNLEGTTLTGLIVAGAVGFGLAWLFLNRYGTDEVARGMSESSGRYGPDYNRRRHEF